jgi:hypothetical protein
MMNHLDPPLRPRDEQTLRVLGICRISTDHQDQRSLEDQEALLRRFVRDHYDGSVSIRIIAGRGSGEYLDRKELAEAEELIESRSLDLVLAEDLARLCRRVKAYGICETAQDCGTRLIAINDHVDTSKEDWHLGALFSVFRHESYTRDTGKRIRRSLRNRFAQGGVVQSVIYGYIKPPGTKTDSELRKDDAAGPIYDQWFRLLEGGASYGEVADWLNAHDIRPGPACRSTRWNLYTVRGVTLNPILKGVRIRNKKMTKRVNKTGRPRCVDAPAEERLERSVPHLAFIEPERYDRVIALLAQRNSKFRRSKVGGVDPRKDVSRKRTLFPGQHMRCGICGRLYYFGGHGRKSHMMCSGNRVYRCWNGVSVDAKLAAEKICQAVIHEVMALPEFDAFFVEMVRGKAEALRAGDARRVEDLKRQESLLEQQIANITAAIAELNDSRALLDKLRSLERERDRLAFDRQELERLPRASIELPDMSHIRALVVDAMNRLLRGSHEAGGFAQRLIPRLEVRPCQVCDGGGSVLRAYLTLDLVPLVPDADVLEGRTAVLRRELVVDLFEPPQRVAYRERVMALRSEGVTEKTITRKLGLTVTATQRAASLDRLMKQRELADPYVPLTEPPAGQVRMRRHNHARYRFEPDPQWAARHAGITPVLDG